MVGMNNLKDMMTRVAQPGRVAGIWIRPARLQAPQAVPTAAVTEAGLAGDHGRPGKRAVTLIQAEHLAAIGSYLGQGPVDPALLRRNLIVDGINLLALRDRQVTIGSAVLQITGPCAPCSRMEEALGQGGYAAMRGHGGMTARVISPGRIAVGDPVVPTHDRLP